MAGAASRVVVRACCGVCLSGRAPALGPSSVLLFFSRGAIPEARLPRRYYGNAKGREETDANPLSRDTQSALLRDRHHDITALG